MAKKLFVRIDLGLASKEVFEKVMPLHEKFVQQLIDQGRKVWSGGFSDSSGGLLVFEAENFDEALKIVQSDPIVDGELVSYTLKEWPISISSEKHCEK